MAQNGVDVMRNTEAASGSSLASGAGKGFMPSAVGAARGYGHGRQQSLQGQTTSSNPITAANQRRYAEYLARSFNIGLHVLQPTG